MKVYLYENVPFEIKVFSSEEKIKKFLREKFESTNPKRLQTDLNWKSWLNSKKISIIEIDSNKTESKIQL